MESSTFQVRSGTGKPREYAVAEYEYTFNGVGYAGSRVTAGILSKGDESHLYTRLKEHLETGEPVDVLCDPAAPQNAMLYREFGYQPVVMLGIGGSASLLIGLVFIAEIFLSERKRGRPAGAGLVW
jgi:hypothetical protein